MRTPLLALALAVLATACSSTEAPAPSDGGSDAPFTPDAPDATPVTPTNVPGRHEFSPTLEEIKREFFVYVPEKASGTAPVPVVFVVHGTGGSGPDFAEKSPWPKKADSEGIILVFPTALLSCHYDDDNHDGVFSDPAERQVVTKWAAGKLGDPSIRPLCTSAVLAQLPEKQRALADHPVKDDVAFFRYMADYVTTHFATDPKRFYVTGFSNGGEMSSRLAAEASDRFAAVAASAGVISVAPATPPRPMSFVYTLGDRDPLWVPGMLASVPGLTTLPLSADLLTQVPKLDTGTVQRYLTLLQLKNEHTYEERTISGKKVSTFTFDKSAIGATNKFHLAVIEDLLHAYPNGTNHPINFADLLWTFFKDERLP